MACKKSIVLVVFLLISHSCKFSKNSETEPNNTFVNANRIEVNSEINGTIDNENDVDTFLININEEQILRISLTGVKGINHAIQIYRNDNARPQLIKTVDDNRKSSSETFSNLFVNPGQYFITVTHGNRDLRKGNKDTPYTLKITSRSFVNEEREPNDTPYTSTELKPGEIVKGYFSPALNPLNAGIKNAMQEQDWYRFNANIIDSKPSLIDVRLSRVEGVDSVLKILNSALEEIIIVDNGAQGEGEVLSDFGLKESGVYYVQVCSKNFLFNNDIPYELQLNFKDHEPNSELEPNNSIETANSVNGRICKGKINGLTDRDFWKFIPDSKNSYYSFQCSGNSSIDMVLTVYDEGRNRLFEVNNTAKGASEKIPPFIIGSAVYISVSASGDISTELEYQIEINEDSTGIIYESEPNDKKADSNVLEKEVNGYINNKNDKDFYLIKKDASKRVRFTIKGIKGGRLKVSTTDPLGYIIKSNEVESDNELIINETIDKKGYLIVEPVIPVYDNPYSVKIEEIK